MSFFFPHCKGSLDAKNPDLNYNVVTKLWPAIEVFFVFCILELKWRFTKEPAVQENFLRLLHIMNQIMKSADFAAVWDPMPVSAWLGPWGDLRQISGSPAVRMMRCTQWSWENNEKESTRFQTSKILHTGWTWLHCGGARLSRRCVPAPSFLLETVTHRFHRGLWRRAEW